MNIDFDLLKQRWAILKSVLREHEQLSRKSGLSRSQLEQTLEEVDRILSAAAGTKPTKAVLYVDGAARGNPGPAGAGIRLEGEDGEVLVERAVFLGQATNNVAEYRALIYGLELAKDIGVNELRIRTDSQLLARQINGRYRVRNSALLSLWSRAQNLLKSFRKWVIEEIPRAMNKDADRLANLAIDQQKAETGGA